MDEESIWDSSDHDFWTSSAVRLSGTGCGVWRVELDPAVSLSRTLVVNHRHTTRRTLRRHQPLEQLALRH